MEYVKIKYRGECSIMFCGNCGKKIDENAKFCPYCGVSVNKKLLKDEKTFPDPILAQKKYKRIRTIVIGAVIIAAVGIGAVAVRQKKLDDEYNTYLYDPVKKETYPYGMNDSTDLFQKAGNVFITYVESVSY